MRIDQVQLLSVDLGLIGFDRTLKLLDDKDLVLGLLPRDGILLDEGLIAGQVHLCLVEKPLIMDKLALVAGPRAIETGADRSALENRLS